MVARVGESPFLVDDDYSSYEGVPASGADLDEDVAIYTCTGCGSYGSVYGMEHACWRNPDGSREVGGSFQ